MATVIAADARRRQAMGWGQARYRPFQRVWIEPWFNVLGALAGFKSRWLPASMRQRFYFFLNRKMAGHAPEENPELPRTLSACKTLAHQLQEATGRWPAFLVLSSHPETVGPLAWLRFELLRQALVVTEAVAQGNSKFPQCFLAIDPYALDTVSPAVGGFYAGFMKQVYLVWDRQPSTQSWIQRRVLLRGTGYDRIAWQLLRRLKRHPILMAHGGGLPYNTRMLYTAREFIQRLKPTRWPVPKRAAEKRFFEILMEAVDGVRPAEEGELPGKTRQAIQAFFSELGYSSEQATELLDQFAREWKLPVPYRQRLFQVLVQRLAARGQPLMILTASHRDTVPHVQLSEPCAIFKDPRGQLRFAGGPGQETKPFDLQVFLQIISRQISTEK
ncbi:MAG: hypothetical protein WC859_08540 [Elusimicrobiota bacterium]|jgi:hypothetical protein